MKRKVNDPVDNPAHYNQHPSGVSCIEIAKYHSFCVGNALKYIWRHEHKGNPIEDLKKAIFYLQRQIEIYEDQEHSRQ